MCGLKIGMYGLSNYFNIDLIGADRFQAISGRISVYTDYPRAD